MEVLHLHCAGLDVHKETLVACVCRMDRQVRNAVKTFPSTTRGGDGFVGLAFQGIGDACCDGGDRGLLEAGMAHSLGWEFHLVLANAALPPDSQGDRAAAENDVDNALVKLALQCGHAPVSLEECLVRSWTDRTGVDELNLRTRRQPISGFCSRPVR